MSGLVKTLFACPVCSRLKQELAKLDIDSLPTINSKTAIKKWPNVLKTKSFYHKSYTRTIQLPHALFIFVQWYLHYISSKYAFFRLFIPIVRSPCMNRLLLCIQCNTNKHSKVFKWTKVTLLIEILLSQSSYWSTVKIGSICRRQAPTRLKIPALFNHRRSRTFIVNNRSKNLRPRCKGFIDCYNKIYIRSCIVRSSSECSNVFNISKSNILQLVTQQLMLNNKTHVCTKKINFYPGLVNMNFAWTISSLHDKHVYPSFVTLFCLHIFTNFSFYITI